MWAQQAPVPEVPGSLLTGPGQLLLRLEQRAQPQTLVVFLVDPPWLPLPFLAAVPERLFFLVTHELFVRTASSALVFASARRRFVEHARTKPPTELWLKSSQAYLGLA